MLPQQIVRQMLFVGSRKIAVAGDAAYESRSKENAGCRRLGRLRLAVVALNCRPNDLRDGLALGFREVGELFCIILWKTCIDPGYARRLCHTVYASTIMMKSPLFPDRRQNVPRRLRDLADRTEAAALHHQRARQAQGAALALGAAVGILDAFEVEDVGEAEDAADHLGGGEAEGVGEQAAHVAVLQAGEGTAAGFVGEERLRVGVTGGSVAVPERQEAGGEFGPDGFGLPQNPFLVVAAGAGG